MYSKVCKRKEISYNKIKSISITQEKNAHIHSRNTICTIEEKQLLLFVRHVRARADTPTSLELQILVKR